MTFCNSVFSWWFLGPRMIEMLRYHKVTSVSSFPPVEPFWICSLLLKHSKLLLSSVPQILTMPPPRVGPCWPSSSTTTAQFWTWPGHWPYIEETILADTGHTRAAALTRTAATPQGLSWERSYPLIWLQPDQSLENIKPVQNIGKVKWNYHSLQTMLALCTQ